MTAFRQAAKRDDAEPAVIEAFRAAGASVVQLSGTGLPDLLVGHKGVTHLVEVKTGNKRLRQTQVDWIRDWRGEAPVTVRTAPQARRWLRVWSDRRVSLGSVLRASQDATEAIPRTGQNEPEDTYL